MKPTKKFDVTLEFYLEEIACAVTLETYRGYWAVTLKKVTLES